MPVPLMPAMSPTVWDSARRAVALARYCRVPSSAEVASTVPSRSVMSPRRLFVARSRLLRTSEAHMLPWVNTVMANQAARPTNITTTSVPTSRMFRRSSFILFPP